MDLSNIHKLKKLKEIYLPEIKASDLNNMQSLPAAQKIDISTFHFTKDDHLIDKENAETPVKDNDFKFFKNTKNLEDLFLRIGNTPHKEYGEGWVYSSYKGSVNFIDYISYKLKKLNLVINFDIENQSGIQDVINKICNRFLKLEELRLQFGIAITSDCFDRKKNEYKKKLIIQTLDVKKFAKLKKLKVLSVCPYGEEHFINYRTINFQEIIKLKKIKDLHWDFKTINFQEFRKAKELFMSEKYDDPTYYDYDYKYYAEEDSEYKKNWTRFTQINTEHWGEDFISLNDRYIDSEKK